MSDFFSDYRPHDDDAEVTVIFDHGSRTTDELNANIVQLALDYGWRGADAEDYMFIRTVLGDEPAYSGQPPIPILNGRGVREDDMAYSENLTWLAEDAETYLNDQLDGWAVGNDGEVGAFILASLEWWVRW